MKDKTTAEEFIKEYEKEREEEESKISLPTYIMLIGLAMFVSGLFGYSEGAKITDSEIGWLLAIISIMVIINSIVLFIVAKFVVSIEKKLE